MGAANENVVYMDNNATSMVAPEVVEAMRGYYDDWRSRSTPAGHYGLVHRDLHAGNFLVENGDVQIIDFDLGCYGWRTMDLAVLLFIYYYYC